eukprot:snap_masked-scaffold132_size323655-processed-gene-2.5 protein:Tk07905 transcript:snap_masked-scaffold132_size323655-processed-gene-2.5-mRNA-1 annotation:"-carotene 9 -oxygenase"
MSFGKLFENASEGDSSGPIVGRIPSWVTGSLIYNGPVGQWEFEKESARHWFDGMSILQSFKVDQDKQIVYLKKRFLQSEAYHKANTHGKLIITEYGTPSATDPDKNLMSRLVSSIIPGEMTDNCACSIYQLGGLCVTATETCLLRVVDPQSLSTGDKIDLSSMVNIASGRPITDHNGDVYNISGTFLTGIKYHIMKFTKSNETDPKAIASSAEIVATIPSRMKTYFSYYHSFGMSENYFFFIEQPWVANTMKLISSKVKGIAFLECLEWMPEEKNQFHLVERSSGKTTISFTFKTKHPFFFLNHINTFEDGKGNLVADLLTYDSPDLLQQLYLEKLKGGKFEIKDESKIQRFVIPLQGDQKEGENLVSGHGKASAVREGNIIWLEPNTILEESGCEHPSINPVHKGKPYKFSYVIGWMNSVNRGFFANAITKVNMDTGETVCWKEEEFCHPAEAMFIPKPAQNEGGSMFEDDGIIMASVTDVREDHKDFIVFLDARTMAETARAKFDDTIAFASHAYLYQG